MKDKVIFWFGADFTQFCMAYYFQNKYDCEMYSIIDITNKPKQFFKHQKLINFKKTWYLHDHIKNTNKEPNINYLASFEKKHGINLWALAINERIFYRFYNFHQFDTNEILTIDEQICRLFEQIFSEVKPDYFVTKASSFHHLELFSQMCRFYGTKVLTLSSPKIGYKTLISENPSKIDYIDSLDGIEGKDHSFEELQTYLESISTKEMVKKFWDRHGNSKAKTLKAFFDYILSSNENIKTNYNYFGRTKLKVLSNAVISSLKKKYRAHFMKKKLTYNVNLTIPFVYFPLSIDLERNMLLDAPFATNQIEIIRHTAKSLPVGYRILVKEHPEQRSREWRPISEYNKIMKIPNVTLIHPSFPNSELMKNCKLVLSIAGSSAFEAAFYGKPSIVFGNILYSLLPSVTKVREIESLPIIIRKSLEIKVNPKDISKYLNILNQQLVDFDWAGFVSDFHDWFYYGGSLRDTKIDENKMKSFLEEKKDELDKLAIAHIQKIKQHKTQMPKLE